MRKLVAWLTGGTPVVLRNSYGECYYSIGYRSPFGERYARVYWFTKVGHVVLNDDGTCSGESSYIKRWIRG